MISGPVNIASTNGAMQSVIPSESRYDTYHVTHVSRIFSILDDLWGNLAATMRGRLDPSGIVPTPHCQLCQY